MVMNIFRKNTNHCWVFVAKLTGICASSQGKIKEKSGIFFSQLCVNPDMFQTWPMTKYKLQIHWAILTNKRSPEDTESYVAGN